MNLVSFEEEFVCPACRQPILCLDEIFRCTGCTSVFSVVNGIPRFVPNQNYSDSFGLQWNLHCKTQLDSSVGKPISEDRLFQSTGWTRELTGAKILEAGSGAGRFTEVLCRTGATIFSFDFSNAVEANSFNNGACANLHLFQGDILAIPLPEAWFDHVLCLGVLQHTMNPKRCFLSLVRHIKPGGDIVIDVYRRSLATLLQWKYLLRPLTRTMKPDRLYSWLGGIIPVLVGPTRWLRRVAGRVGARLSPIVEYTHLGLTPEQNLEWALLDTFDMYAPTYDKPQTLAEVWGWFREAGLVDVEVFNGINGIVGRGRRPIE